MATLTLSLIQMDVRKGNPRANWPTMQQYVVDAAQRGAQLVTLPELWDSGASYDKAREVASSLSGGLFAQVVALSRQNNIHILGSMYEKRGVGYYNTIPVVSPRNGIMGAYRKIHLFPLMNEDKWLLPGEAPLAIDLPWGRTAFGICYDLRFPELFRRYAQDRAEIMIMAMAWPHPRLNAYRTLLRARAIENQCYIVATNRVGVDEDGTHYFGHSSVIDPNGEIVLEAGEVEGHFTVTIDLDLIKVARRDMPALNSMRL